MAYLKPFLLYLLTFQPGFAQTADTPESELTRTLNEICEAGTIIGFSVALADSSGVKYAEGFGFGDAAKGIKYGKNTVQAIASISKTVIGIALLKAQEQGALKLDDPVNNYLPFKVNNPRFPEIPITLRHLTTHTSGITDPDEYDKKGYVLIKNKNGDDYINPDFRPPSEMMSLKSYQESILSKDGQWYHRSTFRNKEPGAEFEYSNIGAGLVALALEQATGMPYNEFADAYIFTPLEMTDSGWFQEEVNAANLSRNYTEKGRPMAPYTLVNYPDGGLITSSEDLGKYLSELIRGYTGQGTILKPESYREFFTPQLEAAQYKDRNDSQYNDEYNMGIFMGFSATGEVGHTGGDPGVSTLMFFNSKTGLGKLLITNTDLDNTSVVAFWKIWETLEAFEERF
jgi:CubicO group peptidase (beta-lactamase class C family)